LRLPREQVEPPLQVEATLVNLRLRANEFRALAVERPAPVLQPVGEDQVRRRITLSADGLQKARRRRHGDLRRHCTRPRRRPAPKKESEEVKELLQRKLDNSGKIFLTGGV